MKKFPLDYTQGLMVKQARNKLFLFSQKLWLNQLEIVSECHG